jgi:hypothetical protein
MREQDVIDALERIQREIADARAGIDQDVFIEKEAGRAAIARDRARAAENLEFHAKEALGTGARALENVPAPRAERKPAPVKFFMVGGDFPSAFQASNVDRGVYAGGRCARALRQG